MANSRRSRPADSGRGSAAPGDSQEAAAAGSAGVRPATDAVVRAVAQAIASWRPRDAGCGGDHVPLRVAIALSGGRDSMVLLDVAAALLRDDAAAQLCALHVHHGLSPNADAWAAFCAAQCTRRGVPLTISRVDLTRTPGESLEAAARAARFAAFANSGADVIALAHHADDQAETLLLQLLRGAGPKGLASMPESRTLPNRMRVARPLLSLPQAKLAAYATAHGIEWIVDESNADTNFRRNFLRHEIAPALARAFPGFPATIARAASHQAEAARLADDLAEIDARGAIAEDPRSGATLDRATLIALAGGGPHRARNLLRWFLRHRGLRAPSAARLDAMLDQLVRAAPDARVRIAHDGVAIGIHRGQIGLHALPAEPFCVCWQGESELSLPHGILEFAPARGAGLKAAALMGEAVTVRSREGGERIRLGLNRPRQTLKRLLQDAGIPPWQRDDLPLVWCANTLAAVPGLGVAIAFQADADAAGYELRWHPGDPKR